MKRIYACIAIVAVLLGVAFYSSWKGQPPPPRSSPPTPPAPATPPPTDPPPRRPLPMVPPGATRCGKR